MRGAVRHPGPLQHRYSGSWIPFAATSKAGAELVPLGTRCVQVDHVLGPVGAGERQLRRTEIAYAGLERERPVPRALSPDVCLVHPYPLVARVVTTGLGLGLTPVPERVRPRMWRFASARQLGGAM